MPATLRSARRRRLTRNGLPPLRSLRPARLPGLSCVGEDVGPGPWLADMIIESQATGIFMKNGFVVSCENTREAVLIDPGDEIQGLLNYIEQKGLAIRHILLTHAHVDHITGVAAAKRALGVPV